MPKALVEFVRDERWKATRAACKICKLPNAVRVQLRETTARAIKPQFVIAWLKAEHNIAVDAVDLRRHTMGRHDAR